MVWQVDAVRILVGADADGHPILFKCSVCLKGICDMGESFIPDYCRSWTSAYSLNATLGIGLGGLLNWSREWYYRSRSARTRREFGHPVISHAKLILPR